MPLRLVLIGPDGTIGADGRVRLDLLDELGLFARRMNDRGVQVAFWAQHDWTIDGRPVADYFSDRCGVPVRLFRANSGSLPLRQCTGSVDPILAKLGIQRHEAILVGNREADFQAGVNNKLLLVRPNWYPNEMQYGFRVENIGTLARFCELFGLREHPVYWSVDDGNLQVRTMGPFSTMIPDFATFGADARATAKDDAGERRFWFLMVVSSLYFSGLLHQVDYICLYPGHNPASTSAVRRGLDAIMARLGKCFRKTYLPDLIVRHTAAVKSQTAPADRKTFRNQINTIHLNRRPRSYDKPEPRKTPLSIRGKTVLVVDDICTNGRSLDAARAYIEAAGGHAILFAWLKTVGRTPFLHMRQDPALRPYEPNEVVAEPTAVEYGNLPHVIDHDAPPEIDALLTAYKAWNWPPRGGA